MESAEQVLALVQNKMAQTSVNFVHGWPICSFLQLTVLGF